MPNFMYKYRIRSNCSHTLENRSLGHTAIIQFFDDLPRITYLATITPTGSPGVPELTAQERKIATHKGMDLNCMN